MLPCSEKDTAKWGVLLSKPGAPVTAKFEDTISSSVTKAAQRHYRIYLD